jgi:predicted component of type VI protein secretion system
MVAKLVVKAGLTDKGDYTLEPGKAYTIGRSREADVIVKDQQSSRQHCKLEASPTGEWTLSDQNSSNGTYVNRHRVTTHPLRAGDLLQVGKAIFEFTLVGAAAAAPTPEAVPAPAPSTPAPTLHPTERAAGPPPDVTPPPPGAPRKDQSTTDTGEPKLAGTDPELKDLFAFLDRVEAGDRAEAPKRSADRPAETEPRPRPAAPSPPAPAKPAEKDDDAPFLDLVKEDGPPPEPKRAAPAPAEKKERGGLLAFLRKKKQQP